MQKFWILVLILSLVVICPFSWYAIKETYKSSLGLFLEKMQKDSSGKIRQVKIEKYNSQLCFVHFETDAKEELLYSVFLLKNYAILERVRFIRDDSWFSANEEKFRIVEFQEEKGLV